jgi:hypothetical protein
MAIQQTDKSQAESRMEIGLRAIKEIAKICETSRSELDRAQVPKDMKILEKDGMRLILDRTTGTFQLFEPRLFSPSPKITDITVDALFQALADFSAEKIQTLWSVKRSVEEVIKHEKLIQTTAASILNLPKSDEIKQLAEITKKLEITTTDIQLSKDPKHPCLFLTGDGKINMDLLFRTGEKKELGLEEVERLLRRNFPPTVKGENGEQVSNLGAIQEFETTCKKSLEAWVSNTMLAVKAQEIAIDIEKLRFGKDRVIFQGSSLEMKYEERRKLLFPTGTGPFGNPPSSLSSYAIARRVLEWHKENPDRNDLDELAQEIREKRV